MQTKKLNFAYFWLYTPHLIPRSRREKQSFYCIDFKKQYHEAIQERFGQDLCHED